MNILKCDLCGAPWVFCETINGQMYHYCTKCYKQHEQATEAAKRLAGIHRAVSLGAPFQDIERKPRHVFIRVDVCYE